MNRLHFLQHLPPPLPAKLSSLDLTSGPARSLGSDWWHVPDPDNGPAALRRPAVRARARLQRLLHYLWDGPAPSFAGAVCQHDTRPGHPGTRVYGGIHLDGVLHYLSDAGSLPPVPLRHIGGVRLIAGSCLFSAQAAQLVLSSRRRFPITDLRRRLLPERATGLHLSPDLTVYEHDTSARLARAATSLAARIPFDVGVTHVLAVPRAATMLHLFGSAQLGLVPLDLFEQWCAAVAERHERVRYLLRVHWQNAWAAVDASRPLELIEVDELQPVEDLLRRALAAGTMPTLGDLVEAAAAQDELWQHLIAINPPATATDLANLSYAASYLRLPGATLAVENIQEHKILLHALRLRPLLEHRIRHVPALMGLYPLGRIWARTPNGDLHPHLFSHDPGLEALDAGGRRVDLAELATGLYRSDALAVRR
ncbi:hypothetical protein [Nonomuraea aridisoli]|uniref:Uncharacterized protein n=1 Tax=Nonomuraea aridisoli TaxID=2070368 RepID=A0A2W2EZP3_9ACTN|nr:hypothetical protein [Nonomuraea aridisoli]PZG18038.1 hypothetical protein C1J01_16345 [Nonomuraea aridisoli]